MKTFKEILVDFDACEEGLKWAGDKTIEEVISTVERGDWVLWLGDKLGLPLDKMTLAESLSAKTAIHLMEHADSVNAVNVAEMFGIGKSSLEELSKAANRANAVLIASDSAYAACTASYAATYAAKAAACTASWTDSYPARAADYAADAIYAASKAAWTAIYEDAAYPDADADEFYISSAANAAKIKNQEETAIICTEILGDLIIDGINTKLNEK